MDIHRILQRASGVILLLLFLIQNYIRLNKIQMKNLEKLTPLSLFLFVFIHYIIIMYNPKNRNKSYLCLHQSYIPWD